MQRVVAGAIVISVLAVRPHGQTGDVDRVLSLTRAYLLTYEQQLSAVVAEEHYDQWIAIPAGLPAGTTTGRTGDRIADPGRQSARWCQSS